jgi:hypothetical protein
MPTNRAIPNELPPYSSSIRLDTDLGCWHRNNQLIAKSDIAELQVKFTTIVVAQTLLAVSQA